MEVEADAQAEGVDDDEADFEHRAHQRNGQQRPEPPRALTHHHLERLLPPMPPSPRASVPHVHSVSHVSLMWIGEGGGTSPARAAPKFRNLSSSPVAVGGWPRSELGKRETKCRREGRSRCLYCGVLFCARKEARCSMKCLRGGELTGIEKR
jgi:hypothetical protein